MPFEFINLEPEGIILVKPTVYRDSRGLFSEVYKASEYVAGGIGVEFKQDNMSVSSYGVLRGIHYQKGIYSQAKLVRCIKGKIFDIAVDLRSDSPSFKQSVRVELSEANGYSLYIPKGFGHGFVSLSDEAVVLYKTDAEYNKEADSGIFWADSDLNIDWGIDFQPVLSEKDIKLPGLSEVIKCLYC